jgi:hypothetical protein
MKAHWKYFKYVMRHKFYVLYAGMILGAGFWRLIIHDWTKFLPSEWFGYVSSFYDERVKEARDFLKLAEKHPGTFRREDVIEASGIELKAKLKYKRSWLLHQKRNKHHWQYWLLFNDHPGEGRYIMQAPDVNFGPFIILDKVDDTNCEVMRHFDDYRNYSTDIEKAAKEFDRSIVMLDNLIFNANRFPIAIAMPDKYVKEMVADWAGAGRGITGEWGVSKWYERNKKNIILHPVTRKKVEELIEILDLFMNTNPTYTQQTLQEVA